MRSHDPVGYKLKGRAIRMELEIIVFAPVNIYSLELEALGVSKVGPLGMSSMSILWTWHGGESIHTSTVHGVIRVGRNLSVEILET